MAEEKSNKVIKVDDAEGLEIVKDLRLLRESTDAALKALQTEFQERHKSVVEQYKIADKALVEQLNERLGLFLDQPIQVNDDYRAEFGVAFVHLLPMPEKVSEQTAAEEQAVH